MTSKNQNIWQSNRGKIKFTVIILCTVVFAAIVEYRAIVVGLKVPKLQPTKFQNQGIFKGVWCNANPIYGTNCSCSIKAIGRNNLVLNMATTPIRDVTAIKVHVALYKRANGWRPYYLKATVDFCDFLGGKFNPILNIVKYHIKKYSNMNHTCPYYAYDRLYLKNLVFDNFDIGVSVVPEGDYRLDVQILTANRTWMGDFKIYGQVKEVFVGRHVGSAQQNQKGRSND